tara:strand:- start:4946 stop:5413 length:468 start_codon:yes stop_codon:yes gene_type:complete
MRQNTWTNADGLVVEFGTRDTINLEAGLIHTLGNTQEIQMDVFFDHEVTAYAAKSAVIPAGSVIRSAHLVVTEAFAAGTSVSVGIDDVNGTGNDDLDIDALIGVTVTADIDAIGNSIEGAGVSINGEAMSEDVYITVDIIGAYTAGQAKLVVTFA